MRISVVVPALNEERVLPVLFAALRPGLRPQDEVIVADGGSSDRTRQAARALGARRITEGARGRGVQMNRGAAEAAGEVLWFLHADSRVPPDWRGRITETLSDPGVAGGAFLCRIDARGIPYRFLDAWGRVRSQATGIFYGDQGIFVRRPTYEEIGGFPEWPVLEDVEFSRRMRRRGKVRLVPAPILTSARRWEKEGWWKTVAVHSARAFFFPWYTRRFEGVGPPRGEPRT